jgi:transposase
LFPVVDKVNKRDVGNVKASQECTQLEGKCFVCRKSIKVAASTKWKSCEEVFWLEKINDLLTSAHIQCSIDIDCTGYHGHIAAIILAECKMPNKELALKLFSDLAICIFS